MSIINSERESGKKRILLIDNDEKSRIAIQSLLTKEGHEVITSSTGIEALIILRQYHIDLLLLDYFIPGKLSGEEVVRELRKFNYQVQVIFLTSHPNDHPQREVMKKLDIQGYHYKSDELEKLLLWVDVGLKSAYTIQMLYKSRQGLRYILDATPELHKIQTLENLLQSILLQITGLLGTVNSFLAVLPEDNAVSLNSPISSAFLAMLEEESTLQIHVATGKFHEYRSIENCLDPSKVKEIYNVFKKAEIIFADNYTIIPLVVGELLLGIIYLDQHIDNRYDVEILQIFANQAAVAIQNTYLYTTAASDKLTGVYVRSFFEQWLLRELRNALRQRTPLSLILLDLDRLKQINDTSGHLAGDHALAIMGSVLTNAIRTSDFVGRFGGDEFVVLLPNTPLENVHVVIKRIQEYLKQKNAEENFCGIPVECSIGACGIEIHDFKLEDLPRPIPQSYFDNIAKLLISEADQMLYQAKQNGRGRACIGNIIKWPEFIK